MAAMECNALPPQLARSSISAGGSDQFLTVCQKDNIWRDDRRIRWPCPARQNYTSVCSAISNASFTSIPKQCTVHPVLGMLAVVSAVCEF
jgi:hypothetical protein